MVPSVTRDPQKSDTICTTDLKTGAKTRFNIPKACDVHKCTRLYRLILYFGAGSESGGEYIRSSPEPRVVARADEGLCVRAISK